MIKSVFFYVTFAFFMLGSIYKKIRLYYLRKNSSEEAAQVYLKRCIKGWSQFILKIVGINVNVVGYENIPKESCLFVANHQSSMDIPILLAECGRIVGFVAKKEMLKFKFMSSWMKEIHCIFMDRSNVRESVKCINEGADYLRQGHSLIVFPEGTRSKGPKLGEFKKGSMKLGTKSGVPIVPVTIDGSFSARDGNKHNWIKSCKVNLIFSEPIYPSKLSREEEANLSETIKNIISNNINNM